MRILVGIPFVATFCILSQLPSIQPENQIILKQLIVQFLQIFSETIEMGKILVKLGRPITDFSSFIASNQCGNCGSVERKRTVQFLRVDPTTPVKIVFHFNSFN